MRCVVCLRARAFQRRVAFKSLRFSAPSFLRAASDSLGPSLGKGPARAGGRFLRVRACCTGLTSCLVGHAKMHVLVCHPCQYKRAHARVLRARMHARTNKQTNTFSPSPWRLAADVLRNRGIVLDLEEMLGLLGDICRVCSLLFSPSYSRPAWQHMPGDLSLSSLPCSFSSPFPGSFCPSPILSPSLSPILSPSFISL
jgi:hypothetical protein